MRKILRGLRQALLHARCEHDWNRTSLANRQCTKCGAREICVEQHQWRDGPRYIWRPAHD